jgi:hypothetical protein
MRRRASHRQTESTRSKENCDRRLERENWPERIRNCYPKQSLIMVRREEIADLGFFSKLPGKATPVGYLFCGTEATSGRLNLRLNTWSRR